MKRSFNEFFKEFATKKGINNKYLTPFDMLTTYKGIVEHFKNNLYPYNCILAEYDFDLLIRNDIQEFADYFVSISANCVEYFNFLQCLGTIDSSFKEITFEIDEIPARNWWEKRILKRAGTLYAEEVKFYYGKEIEVCK